MLNIVEVLQAEIHRVHDLLHVYEEIGPTGAIGASLIRSDLKSAEKAIGSGDVAQIIRSIDMLKKIQG